MDSSQTAINAAQELKVPDELLQKLHAANQQFHAAKELLEKAMGGSELDHEKGVEQAQEQLRAAEREVEKITMEIHGSLQPPAGDSRH